MPASNFKHRKPPAIDIIDKVLDACYRYNPDALFIMSLMHQYEERGSLSKKQLQGLYLKAQKVQDIPPAWLATLEATILKMPTRQKSETPASTPMYSKDEAVLKKISAILQKYPQHKRVLFLQSKWKNNEPLSVAELKEVDRFYQRLC